MIDPSFHSGCIIMVLFGMLVWGVKMKILIKEGLIIIRILEFLSVSSQEIYQTLEMAVFEFFIHPHSQAYTALSQTKMYLSADNYSSIQPQEQYQCHMLTLFITTVLMVLLYLSMQEGQER